MPSALDSFNQFLASQGATPQEDKNIIPPNLIQDYNQTLIPQEQQLRVVPQQSIEETNNMLRPEQGTHRTSLGAAYTLDDLETDAEFQAKANRFLEENGWWWDKSIFEYLRDSEYSLSSAIARSMDMRKWSEESKEDYKYLRSKFDNASLGGFKQTMTMVKDLAVDFLLDPINLIAMAASPLYMGASLATKQGIKIATKQALSKKQKSKLTKSMLQDAKKWTGYTAIEGAAWAGAHDYFLQQGDTVIGLRDQVDAGQVAVTTALGTALGGILGGSIGLLTHTSPLLMSKMTLFANETKINNHVNTKGKNPNKQADDLLDDWDVEQTSRGIDDPDKTKKPTLKYFFSQEEKDQKELKKFLSPVQKIIAETIGKPTTQLMKAGKAFKGLGTHLSLFRYDWMRTIFDTTRRGMDRLSFGEMFTRLRGEWHTDLEKALVNIERTGKHKKFGYNAFWIKRLDDTQNDHLFYLLTTRSGKKFRDKGKAGELIMPYGKYKGSKISQETIIGANKLGKLLDGIQGEAARSGMLYGVKFDALLNKKAFLKNYFPHKLQSDFIEAGRETIVKINPETGEREIVVGFKDLLKTYGKTISYKDANGIDQTRVVPYAEPNINIAPSERATVINKFGEKVEGPLIEGLTVDEKAFNMANFRQQAKDQMSDRKSKYYTKNPTEDEIREVATDIKADRIIDDIVKMKDEPFADVFGMEQKLGEKLSTSGRTGFLKERVFRHIPEEDMYRFIDTDVEGVMNDYITNAALMIKREQVFGRNLVIYQERHLQPLMYEMEKGGVHPTERKEIARRLIKMYNKVAGVEIDTPFGKGKTRFVMDGLKVMQALAHLPFATLSSITEPLIMLTRVRSGDTPLAARDIGKALYKEGAKMSEKIKNGIKRQVGIKHKGTKDFGDEYWLEAYKVGLALEQSIYDRLEGLYGEMVDTRLQRITRGFFKTTLLTQWTAAVQLAAFTTGKRLILENTKKLATGRDAWGNKLSKGRIERLTDELNDLNVNEKKAIRAYNSSLDSNGEFDMTIFQYGRGKKQKLRAFYNNDYLNGANRFSREIILIPDITEANKPLWYSHPVGQIFAQFASYPTAFNNTILKRFANEIVKDVKGIPKGMMPVATPKIVATTSLMTGVAMLTNIARSQGHSLEKPTTQVLIDAVDRWGGLGPGQYGYRFWENAQYGGGPIGSVAKAGSGPLVQDILDTVLYRKGIAENIAGNVPFYGWLPWEAKQALRREGKAIDKTLHLPFTAAPKPKPPKKRSAAVYATGGRVTLDKLAIPDKDKMTGLPYHMQAGVVWQGKEKEEGRTGLAEGGEVTADEGDAEVYSLITKDLRKQAPIFKDDDEIDIYNEEEAKKYAKGITEPVYRTIRKDTWQQNLEDIRDAENIGVHLSTEMPSTSEEVVLKGYVRMVRPLNLSSMEVPLEGFNFVEEIQNNSELKNKIIDDSLLPNETAEEIVDDLLFYHDLKKEAIQGKEDLPYLDKILNIVSSHKIREALKDIGYDGIIYGESEPIDQQMEELGLREEFFAGGLARLASKWAKEFFSKKYVGGGQYQKFINDLKKQGKTQEEINAISLEIRNDHLKILKEDIPQFKDVEISKDGSTLNLSKEQLEYLKKKEPTIDRVMVGNHGIYLEFAEPKNKGKKVKARQQYVEWNRNGNKLYQQTKTVNYANYSPGKWYGDIYDYLHPKKIKPKKKVKSKKAISFDSNQVKPVNKQLPLIGSTQRQTIKDNPKTLYVFADSQNKGVGVGKDLKGSSAADARGLPNTVGIVLQRNSSGKNRYWNDYKKDFKGRKTFNGQAVKRHHQQMNEGIEDVMRKVVLEGYDDVVYMSDLGTALEIGQTRFTKDGWDTKFNNLKRYTSDFKKFQGFKDEIGMDRSFGTISREKHLERDIAQVYGPAWKPTETIFKKEPVSGKVIGTAVEPITVMPKGTRDVRSSTLGSNTVMDKPRGSTATDVNVPPSEEYYSKGYKGELEALDKRDPIPTDFKEYKKYVKKLQESDSPYEQELAEELQIEWMKENPGEPFPDDWLPKIIKKKKSTGGIVRKKLAARLQ